MNINEVYDEYKKSPLLIILITIIIPFFINFVLKENNLTMTLLIGGLLFITLSFLITDFFYNRIIILDEEGIKFYPSNKVINWYEIMSIKILSPMDGYDYTKIKLRKEYKRDVKKRIGIINYFIGIYTNFHSLLIKDYSIFIDELNRMWSCYVNKR